MAKTASAVKTPNFRISVSLTERHQQGRRFLKKLKNLPRGEHRPVARQLAADHGVSLDHILKIAKFAQCYTVVEVKRLAMRRTRGGDPMSWTLVSALLAEPDAKSRDRLTEKALKYDWTAAQLRMEIVRKRGFRRPVGPGNKFRSRNEEKWIRVALLGRRWLRFVHQMFGDVGSKSRAGRPKGTRSTPPITQQCADIAEVLDTLQHTAATLKRLLDESN